MNETEIRRQLNILELKVEKCSERGECEEVRERLKELLVQAKQEKLKGLEERITILIENIEKED